MHNQDIKGQQRPQTESDTPIFYNVDKLIDQYRNLVEYWSQLYDIAMEDGDRDEAAHCLRQIDHWKAKLLHNYPESII